MAIFRVHYSTNDGFNDTLDIEAEKPLDAANVVRKRYPSAIVHKTKLVK